MVKILNKLRLMQMRNQIKPGSLFGDDLDRYWSAYSRVCCVYGGRGREGEGEIDDGTTGFSKALREREREREQRDSMCMIYIFDLYVRPFFLTVAG